MAQPPLLREGTAVQIAVQASAGTQTGRGCAGFGVPPSAVLDVDS